LNQPIGVYDIDAGGEIMRGYRRRNRRVNVTIEGVVALAEFSYLEDDANVVILTDDDEEFYVDASDITIRLDRYVNSRVEVTGRVYERGGQSVLVVKRIRVVNEFDDLEDVDAKWRDDFEDTHEYDYWSDDGIADLYARFVKGSRDFIN
jgi:hypothetical protein